MEPKAKNLVIILGPTGVGKSAAAIGLAEKFNGEIINCDSRQVYQGFDIGTDKPSLEMRQRIPHHLLDFIPPSVQFTAADFVRECLRAIRLIRQRSKLPFVVGGTGLYLKALLEGLFPGPGRDIKIRQALEEEARQKGLEVLRKKLENVDPDYARLIGQNDKVRMIRALEVYALTGEAFSRHFKNTKSEISDFHLLKIGLKLERSLLYKKIEDRVERMFQRGMVEEAQNLLSQGMEQTAAPFQALGYKYVLKFIKKEISLEEAISLTKRETRQYAKRQMTWFRKMEGVNWFDAEDLVSLAGFIRDHLHMKK